MNVILDTNVFISGIFFSGPPSEILAFWQNGKIELILSLQILTEYQEVALRISNQYPLIDINPIIELVILKGIIIPSPSIQTEICRDPDDEKFISCAVISDTGIIISGDKDLLELSGYKGIQILKPRSFIDKYAKDL